MVYRRFGAFFFFFSFSCGGGGWLDYIYLRACLPPVCSPACSFYDGDGNNQKRNGGGISTGSTKLNDL